jgi:hypothetical protein
MQASYTSYSSCKADLFEKYHENRWLIEALAYTQLRYHPIETRIINTLRYVELNSENNGTFSYEFCSISRDIGSTFSSVLDKLVRNTSGKLEGDYDIRDYRRFLVKEVLSIEEIGVELNSLFRDNMILPFDGIKDDKTRLNWWDAYNNLKHAEIENLKDGCLSNVLYGMASLAVLYTLISPYRNAEGNLFRQIGYFKPIDMVKKVLFPKAIHSVAKS